jgi:hypothetical protein
MALRFFVIPVRSTAEGEFMFSCAARESRRQLEHRPEERAGERPGADFSFPRGYGSLLPA